MKETSKEIPKEGYHFDEVKHYHYLDGKKLTGTTTFLGVIGKPNLIQWAADLAAVHALREKKTDILEEYLAVQAMPSGTKPEWIAKKKAKDALDTKYPQYKEARLSHRKKKEGAADVGKKAHKFIEQLIKGEVKYEDAGEDILLMVSHFRNWVNNNDIKVIETEKNVYSRRYWIGGIVDLVFMKDGKKYIGDIKTTSGIYDRTPFFQCASYRLCLEETENLGGLRGSCIVRLGKDGTFEEKWSYDYDTDLKGALSALELYRSLKTFK